ncbi:hypothetical protein OG866_40855 [Streptomyces sp. NBC_00663]|uniref:hypothetical protein n=1 Tax=Streptomyces sp. NBC_00663 TaxID=2975801 RepID=UPI002E374125|nr:hypothetical protein [Streptomyces sp. NBC_00663]
MTSRPSTPQSNDPAISPTQPISPFTPAGEPADGSVAAYGDPVDGLVRAAVADRPLDEVARLITLLEQSPLYARATADALRAVGVHRSVDDVTRLVVLLTRPPRDASGADEAIRAAAESRPVEEVTRLMALLQQAPLEPHCGQEAVRAAATGRPVEELVELIGRLAEERSGTHPPRPADAAEPDGPPQAAAPVAADGTPVPGTARARLRGAPPAWLVRLAAVALFLCAVAYFPVHQDGVSLRRYGLVLGLAGLCLLLGLLVTVRPTAAVLTLAVLVPAALAAAQLYAARFDAGRLSRALDLTLAPAWAAGPAAVCAALAALIALVVRPAAAPPAGLNPAERLPAEAQRTAN